MLTQKECILTKLLDCGSMDLEMLEDIQYDLDDILDDLLENDMLSLNNLFVEVFRRGQSDLKDAYNLLLSDLKNEFGNDASHDDELVEQIEELKTLNVSEDVTWYTNCLDTHIYLENYDLYHKYFEKEISDIEDNMGFCFSMA